MKLIMSGCSIEDLTPCNQCLHKSTCMHRNKYESIAGNAQDEVIPDKDLDEELEAIFTKYQLPVEFNILSKCMFYSDEEDYLNFIRSKK